MKAVVATEGNMALTAREKRATVDKTFARGWSVLTTASLTRLKPVWNDRSLSLRSKIRLMHSLVTSIFLYACGSWILTAELQKRIQAMEMRYCREVLRISYKDHATNEEVRAKIQQAIGSHEESVGALSPVNHKGSHQG